MNVLKDMQWGATVLAAGPVMILMIDGAVFWEIALSIFIVVTGYSQYKRRTIASCDGIRLWLREHGHIYEAEKIKRYKSKILVEAPDGSIYEQECSYCLTSQIDKFVSNCHLTTRSS